MKPTAVLTRGVKISILVLFILFTLSLSGCYHYRVINTINEPGTEYRDTVVRSYLWGLVNKPQDFHVPNCTDTCAAIDEVVFSKNFGQSLLTVITLGIVSPVKIQWKCHKPCQRIIEGL
jgi:hypothetical protein